MEKKFFDVASLPKEPVTVKIENKPNLRQFVVVKTCYEYGLLKDEHIFTTDSFKEAVKIAHKSLGEDYYITLEVYEADEETLIGRWYTTEIMSLYKIKEYLK